MWPTCIKPMRLTVYDKQGLELAAWQAQRPGLWF